MIHKILTLIYYILYHWFSTSPMIGFSQGTILNMPDEVTWKDLTCQVIEYVSQTCWEHYLQWNNHVSRTIQTIYSYFMVQIGNNVVVLSLNWVFIYYLQCINNYYVILSCVFVRNCPQIQYNNFLFIFIPK